jgi:TetR/AcrR family transcriptional regulator
VNTPPALQPDAPTEARQKRERRKDARPGELLGAALDLFVEKGFAATRVEEVALRAGVSKGTLFLYFPSKVDLFKAVVRHHLSGLFTEWNAEFETFSGTTADMVRYCMQQWWERVGATQVSGITKLVMTEAHQFPEIADFYRQEVIEPGNDLIRRILQRGVSRGEFRELDIGYAIYSIIAPMIFIIMWKHAMAPCCAAHTPGMPSVDPAAFVANQADIILRGLQASPASSPPSRP